MIPGNNQDSPRAGHGRGRVPATIRTMEDPELILRAGEELLAKNGGRYVCPLPDYVEPPIGKY